MKDPRWPIVQMFLITILLFSVQKAASKNIENDQDCFVEIRESSCDNETWSVKDYCSKCFQPTCVLSVTLDPSIKEKHLSIQLNAKDPQLEQFCTSRGDQIEGEKKKIFEFKLHSDSEHEKRNEAPNSGVSCESYREEKSTLTFRLNTNKFNITTYGYSHQVLSLDHWCFEKPDLKHIIVDSAIFIESTGFPDKFIPSNWALTLTGNDSTDEIDVSLLAYNGMACINLQNEAICDHWLLTGSQNETVTRGLQVAIRASPNPSLHPVEDVQTFKGYSYVLAAIPVDQNWDLREAKNFTYESFFKHAKPELENLEQTISLHFGSLWKKRKDSTPGQNLGDFARKVEKLMNPFAEIPMPATIQEAVESLSKLASLRVIKSGTNITREEQLQANSEFVQELIELIGPRVETEDFKLDKRSGSTGCARQHGSPADIATDSELEVFASASHIIYSQGLGVSPELSDVSSCIDEFTVDESQVIELYFHYLWFPEDSFSLNDSKCSFNEPHVLIQEFWKGMYTVGTIICGRSLASSPLTYRSTSNNVKISYRSEDMRYQSGYAVEFFNLDTNSEPAEISNFSMESYWIDRPEVHVVRATKDANLVLNESSNYKFEIQPSRSLKRKLHDLAQQLLAEDMLKSVILFAEQNENVDSFSGILQLSLNEPIDDSNYDLEDLNIEDLDECQLSSHVCGSLYCHNTEGSFSCSNGAPENLEVLGHAADVEFGLDAESGEEEDIVKSAAGNLALIVVAVSLILAVIVLTMGFCIYKRTYKSRVYRMGSRGQRAPRPRGQARR